MKPSLPIDSRLETARWLPFLLQTNDSMFPTGAYAHSFGLEGVVQSGVVHDPATLASWLEQAILPALAHLELPFVAHAFDAAADESIERLCELDRLYHAMRPTAELRQASIAIGAQRLATIVPLLEHPLLRAMSEARSAGNLLAHAPIIHGATASAAGLPKSAALQAFIYQSVSGLLSASMKLIRIGQAACQLLLTRSLANSAALAEKAATIPLEDAGWFSPLHDIASARHERAYTRLFIS